VGAQKPPEIGFEFMDDRSLQVPDNVIEKKNVQREYFKGLITSQAFNKMTMEYEEKLTGIISKKDELKKKVQK
jgi:hypothetical protein